MVRRRLTIADTLKQRIFSGLHLGTLKPGDRLPSVRDLASDLEADPRVILAACRELEQEGLVELRPRSGIYVGTGATDAGGSSSRKADWIVETLVESLSRGIPAPGLPEHLRRCLETLRLRAACIECNLDQTVQLCEELHADYGLDTDPVDLYPMLSEATPPPEIRHADLLVTSQFHAHEIQPLALQLGKPIIVASLQTGLFAGLAELLSRETVYFLVSDPRFGAKLHRIFAGSPGAANLRSLVVGTDDLAEVPPDAPAYMTGSARARLPQASRLRRPLPQLRALSPDTARQLLSFIVRANMAANAAART